MKLFNEVLKDILTVKNGEDYDFAKVVSIGVILWFMLIVTFIAIITHSFDPIAVGTAVGLILTGTGVNLKLKETTEPDK